MSQHLHLSPFSGVAGDMFLGLLVDLGLDPAFLSGLPSRLGLGDVLLHVEEVERSSLAAKKVHVVIRGWEEGPAGESSTGAPPDHGHARHLSDMLRIVENAGLPGRALEMTRTAIERLYAAEARVHNKAVEEVHLHEAGADDALVDIVGSCAGLVQLGVESVSCSLPLPVGGGTIRCSHGLLPVPAPAVTELLLGLDTIGGPVDRELITPTGAAILRAVVDEFAPQPGMCVERAGHGAGSSNVPGRANVLRGVLGRRSEGPLSREIAVLSTTIDDMLPQDLPVLIDRLLAAGARDAWSSPAAMKKGRQGRVITAIAAPADEETLAEILLRESSTLGVRLHRERRLEWSRDQVKVETPWGAVRVKRALDGTGKVLRGLPEFEDCREAAGRSGKTVDAVRAEARARFEEAEEES